MNTHQRAKIAAFKFDNHNDSVRFIESSQVKVGVVCDVYEFLSDKSKDLAIVSVSPGCSTPRQKVLEGIRTVEGYMSGGGKLVIERLNGQKEIIKFESGDVFQTDVKAGEIMQWHASAQDELIFYEICFPPYADGRFEELK